jgi:hypothetical protein
MTSPARPADSLGRPARQMTAAELAAYRRELEHAISYFDQQDPVPPARADLQARLDTITTRQARTGNADA